MSVKTISRSVGRTATAAAAYRAGAKIEDKKTGEIYNYTRKGGVVSATIFAPEKSPDWVYDRQELWNRVEAAETRKNSTVAREFEIALPSELPPSDRERLAHDFGKLIVEIHGCVVDVAIHEPSKKGDQQNHHAHILVSTRRLENGVFTEKSRELDDKKRGAECVKSWREVFADLQNEYLKKNGILERVDHRSLEAQGIDRLPMPHLGPKAIGYERRTGLKSRRRAFAEEVRESSVAAKELQRLTEELDFYKRAIRDDELSLERLREESKVQSGSVAKMATAKYVGNNSEFLEALEKIFYSAKTLKEFQESEEFAPIRHTIEGVKWGRKFKAERLNDPKFETKAERDDDRSNDFSM